MIRFAVLSTNNQTIDYVGDCEEETLSLQGGSQTALVCPVGVEPDTHYYYNNAFVAYPAKPSEYSTWNTATRTWSTPNSATIETFFDGAEYTVSGATFTTNTTAKTITVSAGTATRTKGVYAESKSFTAATLSYVDVNLPAFIFYNWDNNSLQVVYDFSSIITDSKYVLIAEFDGTTLKNIVENPVFDGTKLLSRSIQTNHVKPESVDSTLLASGSVLRSKIANGAVTADAIAANTITANEIAANTITGNKIAANTITGNKIAANTITGNKIAANTIVSNNIVAGAIGAREIAAEQISAKHLAGTSIITKTAQFNDLVVTRVKIANGSITDGGTIRVASGLPGYTTSLSSNYDNINWLPNVVRLPVGVGADMFASVNMNVFIEGISSPTYVNVPTEFCHSEFHWYYRTFRTTYNSGTYTNVAPLHNFHVKANLMRWEQDGRLSNSFGGEVVSGFIPQLRFGDGTPYPFYSGEFLTVQFGYIGYTSKATFGIRKNFTSWGVDWEGRYK